MPVMICEKGVSEEERKEERKEKRKEEGKKKRKERKEGGSASLTFFLAVGLCWAIPYGGCVSNLGIEKEVEERRRNQRTEVIDGRKHGRKEVAT